VVGRQNRGQFVRGARKHTTSIERPPWEIQVWSAGQRVTVCAWSSRGRSFQASTDSRNASGIGWGKMPSRGTASGRECSHNSLAEMQMRQNWYDSVGSLSAAGGHFVG
jgi:hypothetical protein